MLNIQLGLFFTRQQIPGLKLRVFFLVFGIETEFCSYFGRYPAGKFFSLRIPFLLRALLQEVGRFNLHILVEIKEYYLFGTELNNSQNLRCPFCSRLLYFDTKIVFIEDLIR